MYQSKIFAVFFYLCTFIIVSNSYGDHFNFSVPGTTLSMVFYGDVFTINHVSSEAGDEIAVYDPQGTFCGHFVVTNAGEFTVTVYGDDTGSPEDEGASINDDLTFKVWDASEAVEITLTNAMFIQKDVFGQPQIDTIPPKYLGDNEIRGMGIAITNPPPEICLIENQQTMINKAISLSFQLTDTEGGDMQLSVASSLTSLVTPENIRFTGNNITSDGSNYTVNATASMPEDITMVIQPVSGQAGDAMITLTIDDHGTIVEKAFAYSVLSPFTENENIALSGVYRSSVAFADYDNDGDLDILLSGKSDSNRIARIYNNSSGNFTEATNINLTGVDYSSVAFGDYDNDGDLDLLISGDPLITKLYQNTGDGFVDSGVDLLGVRRSSVAFGDYDNDGDLDILLSGYNGTDAITLLYRNTDGSFQKDSSITLPGVYNSSVAFGDYDNDDDLDILLSGDSDKGRMAKIYQNTGGFFCEDTDNPLPGVNNSSVLFGDYDNDGDLDIVLSGNSDTGKMAKVYQNTNGSFSENTGITLPGIEASAIAWADFDNDGDLDLFLSGNSDTGLIAQLYKNTAGSFYEYTAMTFPGFSQGAVAWGDYDNDGDLDILLTGDSDTGSFAKIYNNNMTVVNTSPAAPQYLTSVVTGQTVQLSWSAGSDAETFSAAGLNYNIQIGSSPGAYDIKAPMALPFSSGYRQIPERGDIQNLTTTVQLNETGTYYWRVQSIDTSFSGSSFSNEYSFTITDIAPAPGNNGMISSSTLYPQASEITLDFSVSSDTISLTTALAYRIYSASVSYGNHINAWEQLSTPLTNWMIDTHTYLISNQHASTDYYYVVIVRDESGNKAIYQPLHMTQFTEMDAISLEGVYRSSAIWGDYDNDADLDILLTGASDSGRIAKIYKNSAGSFAQDFSVNLQGVDYSSVAFGDYDNDGDLDILLTGDVNTAKIYRNSDGIFTEDTAITLSGVRRSAVAFGDYDNDGDLDILLTGHDGSGAIAKVYQQTGGSYSEDTAIILSGVYDGSVAFGDYDNDGDLDILLSGYTGSSRLAKVFKNSGGIYNEDTDITLPGVNYSSAAFGDYDNDGDLDILLSGNSNSGKIAKIYDNSAGRFNENTEIELPGVLSGAVSFGDYDNDGDLDILLSGSTDSGRIAKVYQNTGDNFYEDRAVTLPAVTEGSAAFGDYDNDGDLDMLLSGYTVNGSIVRIYRNNHPDLNTAPTAPLQLTSVVEGDHVRLSWSGASDTETISPTGLSYNVTIGSSPGACDILAPMALPLSNGYRQIPARGAIQTLTATINNLNDGTYYWRVQAIDTAFSGAEFSNEATFIIGETANDPPMISSIENQHTVIDFPISIPFHFTDTEGGDIRISVASSLTALVMPENIRFTGTNITSDGSSYTVNATASMPEDITMVIQPVSGQAGDAMITLTIDDHGTIVEKAFAYSVLSPFTEDENIVLPGVERGSVAFGDYDNDGDLDILLTGSSSSGYIAKVYRNTGGSFSEDTGISLTDVFRSSVAFGDYDNDDDLDILITGYDNNWNPIAKVYRNTGGSFSEDTGISLTGVGASTVAFGDYDNDGDLDILLTGEFSYNNVTAKVYRNTGGSFSEDIGISLTGVVDSSVAFGDYDNDGDLDILLTGYSDSGIIAKVYRNTGGSFSEDTGISLTGVVNSSVAFGDYDNDGDLDILLTGYSSSGNIAKVYRNTGGSFSEDTGIKLTGVKSGSAVFGDYDNDGDLDILLTGSSDSVYIAKVYRNTGGSFSEDTDISLTGVRYSSVAFGDYDNDGDLDILLTGDSDSDQSCRIYKNNYVVSNTSPSAPSHLTSVITGQKVALSWSAGSDAQTMSPTGLSYNLIIGSSSGACDIVAPMSLPHSNGYRQIAARGLIQSLTTTVHINETGTYYWRVQSIDTAFSGSSFSNEYSFTIIDIAPPIPGNNGLISSSTFIPSTSKNIFNWTVASDSISLTSDLEYRIYTSCISYGDHADAWEEFASAASNWVSNTNSYVLNASTHAYHFVIIVRDTSGNKAIYKPLHISLYTEMADIDIAGVYYSSVAYGDYDNDGDLDILLTGYVSFNSMFKFFFLDRIKA